MTLAKERIIDVLKQVVPDKEAEDIVFYLKGKQNISEFIIAEELDLEIHRARNLLYRLLNVNIVSFKRKKDKIKGWYICYWDFNELAIPHLEEKLRLETIRKLQERLSREEGGFFYMCRHAHVRQSFEDAFGNDFKCPECGELMNQQDNEKTISFLKERIAKLEAEQEAFTKEKLAILKTLSKQAEQELKEAQLLGEAKFDKQSAVRAVHQSTLSDEQKVERKKEVRKIARQTATARKKSSDDEAKGESAKKAAAKKATPKTESASVKKQSDKLAVKKSVASKSSVKKAAPKKTTPKKAAAKKATPKTESASVKKQSDKLAVKKSVASKSSVKKATTNKTTSLKKSFAKKVVAKIIGSKK